MVFNESSKSEQEHARAAAKNERLDAGRICLTVYCVSIPTARRSGFPVSSIMNDGRNRNVLAICTVFLYSIIRDMIQPDHYREYCALQVRHSLLKDTYGR
ncbi:MAG: hypothetical protein Q8Q81_02355 [Oxalobacteraceae bacterium]|nr:hypothetical protein [Oxalobacteraceae bacterium]